MVDVEFWSEDGRFGLRVPGEMLSRVLELSRQASPLETGGILTGFYTDAHNLAVVTQATGAPRDSESGRTFFVRGTAGLQRWLNRLWRKERRFYLGDWHSHPGEVPHPSPTDEVQLEEIAGGESRKCPEPVLLLVGGPVADTCDARAYVLPRGGTLVELFSSERKPNQ